MTISLNNQIVEVEMHTMLSNLVSQQLGEKQNGVAVAVNGQVVPRTSWSEVTVNENDEILIIKATQGG
jgi:sulfur carrier protein